MKKERKRLNVIDVVIILLLVALVGTAGYRIYTEVAKDESDSQSNIVVSFEAEVEDEGILNYLETGSAVYLATDKSQLGNLYDPVVGDALGAVYKDKTEESGIITVLGTLRLHEDAHKAQDGEYYVINDRNITVGSTLEVYTDTAVLRITVKSIEVSSN